MSYRCQRCNKELSVPESIRRGYGPVCWAKIHGVDKDMAEQFERVCDVIQYVCPICGLPIVLGEIPYIRFRAILAEHVITAHRDLWKGSLDKTLDELRLKQVTDMGKMSLDTWREKVERWEPREKAAFYQLMEPVYAEIINMEKTAEINLLNNMIWEVQNAVVTGGDVEEHYKKYAQARAQGGERKKG